MVEVAAHSIKVGFLICSFLMTGAVNDKNWDTNYWNSWSSELLQKLEVSDDVKPRDGNLLEKNDAFELNHFRRLSDFGSE